MNEVATQPEADPGTGTAGARAGARQHSGLIVGGLCMALGIGLGFSFDQLNTTQSLIVNVLIALGTAALANEVAGSLELNSKWVRASGGLGVFAVVLFASGSLPLGDTPAAPTSAAATPAAPATPVAEPNTAPLVAELGAASAGSGAGADDGSEPEDGVSAGDPP